MLVWAALPDAYGHILQRDMSFSVNNVNQVAPRHRKQRPNFFANRHLPLTTAFLQVSHDVIPFSCLQVGLSSFVPDVANVLLCISFCLLDHLDLPEFGLNFPPSCLGVSIVFGQPEAISLTWTSVSSHLSKSIRLGCNSSFRLLHRSAITRGSLLITSCM